MELTQFSNQEWRSPWSGHSIILFRRHDSTSHAVACILLQGQGSYLQKSFLLIWGIGQTLLKNLSFPTSINFLPKNERDKIRIATCLRMHFDQKNPPTKNSFPNSREMTTSISQKRNSFRRDAKKSHSSSRTTSTSTYLRLFFGKTMHPEKKNILRQILSSWHCFGKKCSFSFQGYFVTPFPYGFFFKKIPPIHGECWVAVLNFVTRPCFCSRGERK